MKTKVLSFLKKILVASLSFVDVVCVLWCVVCLREEYERMLRLQGEVSLRRYFELLKSAEAFWPFVMSSLLISLALFLLVMLSHSRKSALRQVLICLFISVSAVCCVILLGILFIALPAVFDGTVPLSTVLGDVVVKLSLSGFLLFGILACVWLGLPGKTQR